MKFVAGVRLL
jgi:hypothetical protein